MKHMFGLDFDTFFSLIDNMYDEVIVYDRDLNVVYVNQACIRHYGCQPDKMIGRTFYDFVHADWWSPSILPVIMHEKKAYAIKQRTYMGIDLLTIAVPVFDSDGEVEFVIMNVRDNVNELDLYNPHFISDESPDEPAVTPIANGPDMQRVVRLAARVAPLSSPCLISGEAGVGKRTVARYIHSLARPGEPFSIFDCMVLSEERTDRELFGDGSSSGILERMNGGTLLLTNICGLSLSAQARLLPYLYRDGDSGMTRIIASTDKNIKALVESGQFREDLYYRLNAAEIHVPPLRKRPEDMRPLIYRFLSESCSKYKVSRQLTEGVIQTLIHADWPNNVSQLKYVVERLVIASDSPVIDMSQLPKSLFGIVDSEEAPLLDRTENFDDRVYQFESLLIHDAYNKYHTSRCIADHLGISQTRANNLVRKYITG